MRSKIFPCQSLARALTRDELTNLLIERDGPDCFYCGVGLKIFRFTQFYGIARGDYATFDHIIPKSKGGGFVVQNLVLACADCNSERGNSDAGEFLAKKMAQRFSCEAA